MNVEDRVNRLSALLDRIKRNQARPRMPPPGITLGTDVSRAHEPVEMSGVDELLESSPPPPYVAPPEEEAIPLVAVSAERAPSFEPPAEEIYEEDIVEIAAPEAIEEVEEYQSFAPPPPDAELDYEEEEEQPPVSSRREKLVAGSMDEALASAAEQLDDGRVVPIKTPPPESGPQEAAVSLPPGIHAPPAPSVEELLRAPTPAGGYALGPTPEQLGETIDLEEGGPSSLELDEPLASQVHVHARRDDLEAPLPFRESGGAYDESLTPPPNAREELQARRERMAEEMGPQEAIPEAPYSQRGAAFAEPAGAAVTTTSPAAAVSTVTVEPPDFSAPGEVVARPSLDVSAVQFRGAREFKPTTFLELLDASLELGAE